MSWLAPPKLLTGVAIDDPADPHLAAAGHVRMFANPRLGLPVGPIVVSRSIISEALLKRLGRRDIVWIDSRGVTLTAPFNVRPDNPVTGYLPSPPGSRCIWITVDATPERVLNPNVGPLNGLLVTDRPVNGPTPNAIATVPFDRPTLANPILSLPIRRTGIDVAQLELTPLGPSVVQHRSTAPYELAASQIEQIRVSGNGVVRGVTWLDAVRLRQEGPKRWKLWTLPHADAARYVSLPSAMADAKDRVANGAPLREQLYDAPASTPPTAPAIGNPSNQEVNRVTKRYQGELEKALHRLLTDLSQPAASLSEPVSSIDETTGTPVGTINLNLMNVVGVAAVDPGMSRWLGFADSDPEVRTFPKGTLVLYWIDGWWDDASLNRDTLLGRLLARSMPQAFGDVTDFRRLFDRPPPDRMGRLLSLGTVAPLIVGVPPDRPARPSLGALRSGAWNTTLIPPAGARQVTVPLSGLVAANQLAFARLDSSGPAALNEAGPDGGKLPISAAVLPDATAPGQGEVYDRLGPPSPTRYRIAQADWFGRWSDWSEGLVAAAARPRPPRPVPELFYAQPALPNPMHSLPLSGTIRIRVGVPQPTQLPPGSLLINALEMTLNGGPPELIPVTAGATLLDFTRTGPALARCGTGTITLICRWRNTGAQFSDPSPEIARNISDPRPPPAVILPDTLAYGSRPDVTGKSRIQLTWTGSPGQSRYRIYYSDETTLLTSLEKEGSATVAIRNAIAAAADAAARAAIFVANKARFEKSKFEAVSPDNFSGTAFEHRVSGSLRVLVFYRVVPISAANVEGPFGESTMVPFGIPNSGPPATPLVTVKPVFESGVAQAAIHIRVPRGPVVASEYRLRRSAVESRVVERMPVAITGTVPPLAPDAGPEAMQEVVSFRDTGGSELKSPDPLKPWTAYSWAVEVRGAAEAGSSVAGEWSPPSAPVTTAIIPPVPPAAPTDGQWDGANEISFARNEPLTGGSMGAYSIDLYVEPPGEALTFLTTMSADAPASAGGRVRFNLAGPPVSGTLYRAMVMDPAGRTSPPSDAVVIP